MKRFFGKCGKVTVLTTAVLLLTAALVTGCLQPNDSMGADEGG